jgi:hypothetical protein
MNIELIVQNLSVQLWYFRIQIYLPGRLRLNTINKNGLHFACCIIKLILIFILMIKRKFLISCLIVLTTCAVSCVQLLHTKNAGIWFYTFSNGAISSTYNLTPASFLCLQPDNTYTLDFGKYEYGKWSLNGDTLILQNNGGNISALIMLNNNGKDMKLSTEPGVVCDFESQPYSFSKDAAKPFSTGDNTWRIKATHKETGEAIKGRLVNHCRFWKDYFTWALDNNISTVDVRSTPTPIKIYGNGFALKNFDDLPAEWMNYFYDTADCRIANNMIEAVFTKNDIAWAHTDSKYKMFIGAFEQLEQMLDKKQHADIQ